jgi:hypothetical protein
MHRYLDHFLLALNHGFNVLTICPAKQRLFLILLRWMSPTSGFSCGVA